MAAPRLTAAQRNTFAEYVRQFGGSLSRNQRVLDAIYSGRRDHIINQVFGTTESNKKGVHDSDSTRLYLNLSRYYHMVDEWKALSTTGRSPDERTNERGKITDSVLKLAADAIQVTSDQEELGRLPGWVLPDPYPPCVLPIESLSLMTPPEICAGADGPHHRGKVLVMRRWGSAAVSDCLVTFGAEDGGAVLMVQIRHYKGMFDLESIPVGGVFAIKEPYITRTEAGVTVLRVDHPSDIVVVHNHEGLALSNQQRSEDSGLPLLWKLLGDAALEAGLFVRALRAYSTALDRISPPGLPRWLQNCGLTVAHSDLARPIDPIAKVSPTHEAEVHLQKDICRRRAHVNLLLERYDAAEADAQAAVLDSEPHDHVTSQHTDADARSRILNSKAYYIAGVARYRLRDFDCASAYFAKQFSLTSEDPEAIHCVQLVQQRIQERTMPYDMSGLQDKWSASSPRFDVADQISKVCLRDSPGKGRGLFATEDIAIGQIVLYEKALHSTWRDEAGHGVSMVYDARKCEEPFLMSEAELSDLIYKAQHNTSFAKQLLRLSGIWPGTGHEVMKVDGTNIIDVFQVYDIIMRNSFALDNPKDVSSDTGNATIDLINAFPNIAVFALSSFANHSCTPNTLRRNFGDVMVFTAQKPIMKDEEITITYMPGAEIPKSRRLDLQQVWNFECTCPLCKAQSQDPENVHRHRQELLKEARALVNKHKPKSIMDDPSSVPVNIAQNLEMRLRATYEASHWTEAAKRDLAALQNLLMVAYVMQKQPVMSYVLALRLLRSLAYDVHELPSFRVEMTPGTVVSMLGCAALECVARIVQVRGEQAAARKVEAMASAMKLVLDL